jgi:putative transposase/transposase-like zinc-binding protein
VDAQGPSPLRVGEERPRLEVADIFRAHGEAYRQSHALASQQLKVMRAIETCRTSVLGGHLDVCTACGHSTPAYNSCRNRHCPKCQSLSQAKWIAERMERILPTHSFHVVFTLPKQLRPLALANREPLFDMLFSSASSTLLELAKTPKWLGAQPGITAVLHTWTRELQFHPHVHCIVTGGGLSLDHKRWVATRPDYLFPVKVLSRLFRGAFLDALNAARKNGELNFAGGCANFADSAAFVQLKDRLYRREWVVYSKPPFGGPNQVFNYLGRYTHRVGISNQRLLSFDKAGVRFRTKDGRTITLEPQEFIRRFLLHVLPKRFVKIRHYGLFAASNATTKLVVAKRLLAENPCPQTTQSSPDPSSSAQTTQTSDPEIAGLTRAADQLNSPSPPKDWREALKRLTGIHLSRCPICGSGQLLRRPLAPASLTMGFATARLDTS